MPRLLSEAASQGFEVRIWYVGLASPDLHIERVRNRVRAGGHDIPESSIRRRWRHSRLNLVQLLPHLTELRVYDNSADADPAAGRCATAGAGVASRPRRDRRARRICPSTPDGPSRSSPPHLKLG